MDLVKMQLKYRRPFLEKLLEMGAPLRAPSTASPATEVRNELQRAAGVDTSTPSGIRREYAEYAPAGTWRTYPSPCRKAPAFAPPRFFNTFFARGILARRDCPARPERAFTCPRRPARCVAAAGTRVSLHFPKPHLTHFRVLHARSGCITRRWDIMRLRATWRRRPCPWRR